MSAAADAWPYEAWDRELFAIWRGAPLLRCVAPRNFAAEVARLVALYEAGGEGEPAFTYEPLPALDGPARALEALDAAATGPDPIVALYRARTAEAALELELVGARATPSFAGLAARRWASPMADEGDAEARRLLREQSAASKRGAPDAGPGSLSDDEADPGSLVRRAREEIGRRKLPVRVQIVAGLVPLAAVADGVLQIAAGRATTRADVERTVLHEIDGHLVPAERARASRIGLLRSGTARGSDTQEGWALRLEAAAGHLAGPRAVELALRHVAARAAHAGATFVDAMRALGAASDEAGLARPVGLAVRSAARAFRGGGLGREAAYLPALCEVEAALAETPALAAWIGAGRVSVDAARVLADAYGAP